MLYTAVFFSFKMKRPPDCRNVPSARHVQVSAHHPIVNLVQRLVITVTYIPLFCEEGNVRPPIR